LKIPCSFFAAGFPLPAEKRLTLNRHLFMWERGGFLHLLNLILRQ
jgi:hypothetical protein